MFVRLSIPGSSRIPLDGFDPPINLTQGVDMVEDSLPKVPRDNNVKHVFYQSSVVVVVVVVVVVFLVVVVITYY